MNFFNKLIENFKFPYDHTQCVIKEYSIHPSNGMNISFYGKSVRLHPGKYQFSCKTPFGYQIKYVTIYETTIINIKDLILNKNQDDYEKKSKRPSSQDASKSY